MLARAGAGRRFQVQTGRPRVRSAEGKSALFFLSKISVGKAHSGAQSSACLTHARTPDHSAQGTEAPTKHHAVRRDYASFARTTCLLQGMQALATAAGKTLKPLSNGRNLAFSGTAAHDLAAPVPLVPHKTAAATVQNARAVL
jgi:hypothetical protein